MYHFLPYIILYTGVILLVYFYGLFYNNIYYLSYKNTLNKYIVRFLLLVLFTISLLTIPSYLSMKFIPLMYYILSIEQLVSLIDIAQYINVFIFSYLVGSIPFGLLLTKLFTDKDICNSGSANIGATNVLRVVGKRLAILTLVFDFLKSFLVLLAFKAVDNNIIIFLIGLSSVLGHIFPFWIKFKGGKGVATTLGLYFAYNIYLGLIAIIIWLIIYKIFRYSSLSSMVTVLIASLFSFYYGVGEGIGFTIIALIVICRHYHNIIRLIENDEGKIHI